MLSFSFVFSSVPCLRVANYIIPANSAGSILYLSGSNFGRAAVRQGKVWLLASRDGLLRRKKSREGKQARDKSPPSSVPRPVTRDLERVR